MVDKPGFKSKPVENLYRAVEHLRSGKSASAFAAAEAALGQMFFKRFDLDSQWLTENGFEPFEWRVAVVEAVLRAHSLEPQIDRHEWGVKAKEILLEIARNRGREVKVTPKSPPKKELKGKPVWRSGDTDDSSNMACSTVHGVKGQTHQTTIYYLGKLRADRCPSEQWWDEESEERRIAYVAATRPEKNLILCVHRETLERLKTRRPEFVNLFDICALEDLTPDKLA